MPLYRGTAGATWEIDPPAEGTHRRELFDAQIANGDLVLVEEPKPVAKKAAPAAEG